MVQGLQTGRGVARRLEVCRLAAEATEARNQLYAHETTYTAAAADRTSGYAIRRHPCALLHGTVLFGAFLLRQIRMVSRRCPERLRRAAHLVCGHRGLCGLSFGGRGEKSQGQSQVDLVRVVPRRTERARGGSDRAACQDHRSQLLRSLPRRQSFAARKIPAGQRDGTCGKAKLHRMSLAAPAQGDTMKLSEKTSRREMLGTLGKVAAGLMAFFAVKQVKGAVSKSSP